jgi:hypothetical protein
MLMRALLVLFLASVLNAKSFIYLGAYQEEILVLDDDTFAIVKKIKLKTGQPRQLLLTNDKKKLIVVTNRYSGIEVIDLVKNEVVDTWILATDDKRVRPTSVAVDPTGNLLYLISATYTKAIDRWEIGKSKISVLDISQHKIVKEVDYPKEEQATEYDEGELRISPDGKSLYKFGENVLVFDTTTLDLAKKIDLTKPTFAGMGPISFGSGIDPHDDPGTMTSMFISADPYVHRKIFGIGKFDLNTREFTFSPIGTVVPNMGRGDEGAYSNLRLTPDRKTGYTVAIVGEHGDKACQFWAFDLVGKTLKDKADFPCNSRFSFANSYNGDKLLIFGAGFEISLYDAATMKFVKTVNLGEDVTMSGILMVPSQALAAGQ